MTRAERLAYQRGYQAGVNGRWPAHKPPAPPEPVVAELVAALSGLRDGIDALLSVIDPDDPWEVSLGPKLDAATAALESVTRWLSASEVQS